jgi:hypothetical protein
MSVEQAYVEGFIKRANEYGFNSQEAAFLLKSGGAMHELAALRNSGLKQAPEIAEHLANWRNSAAAGVKKLRSPEGRAEMERLYGELKGTGYRKLDEHMSGHIPRFSPPENSSEFLGDTINRYAPSQEGKETMQQFIQAMQSGASEEELARLEHAAQPVMREIDSRMKGGPLGGLVGQPNSSNFSALNPDSTHKRLLERLGKGYDT